VPDPTITSAEDIPVDYSGFIDVYDVREPSGLTFKVWREMYLYRDGEPRTRVTNTHADRDHSRLYKRAFDDDAGGIRTRFYREYEELHERSKPVRETDPYPYLGVMGKDF
jgi:hypothetical protein